jgi:hypothetical protein
MKRLSCLNPQGKERAARQKMELTRRRSEPASFEEGVRLGISLTKVLSLRMADYLMTAACKGHAANRAVPWFEITRIQQKEKAPRT